MSHEKLNKLKDVGNFSTGMVMGMVIGGIPVLGFPLGFFALGVGNDEPEQRHKSPGEHWVAFVERELEREKEDKKFEALNNGMATGVVIGWIGQIAAFGISTIK